MERDIVVIAGAWTALTTLWLGVSGTAVTTREIFPGMRDSARSGTLSAFNVEYTQCKKIVRRYELDCEKLGRMWIYCAGSEHKQ